ncbi:Nn.00g063270.m01.CDS01 [Neocucurbitaria sp. VM-36]
MKHNYSKSMMIGLAIAFLILPFVFVCLRLWAKRLSKRIGWDDYLTIAALAVSMTCTAIHGYLGSHQPLDANGQPIMDDPGLIFFEETKFAINMISIIGLGLVKSSILVLYKNIFAVRKFRFIVYCVLAYVICWTVSFSISHLFTCYPITVFIEPYYGNKCVQTVPMFLALLYTDVIADIVILVLPIPMVLNVRMELKKKVAVIAMLTLGAAVCAVSITRVVATYSIAGEYLKHPDDVIYYTAPVFFWTNIELSLGVVCACLPTLRPIWFFFYPRQVTQTGSGYGYGSSGLNGTKNSSFGGTLGRKPYQEIDEVELTRIEHSPPTPPEDRSSRSERGIVKAITIHQTLG